MWREGRCEGGRSSSAAPRGGRACGGVAARTRGPSVRWRCSWPSVAGRVERGGVAARTWWSSSARAGAAGGEDAVVVVSSARKFGTFSRSEGGALADPHVSGRDRILWRTVGRVRHRKEGFCGAPLEGCATEMRDIFFFKKNKVLVKFKERTHTYLLIFLKKE